MVQCNLSQQTGSALLPTHPNAVSWADGSAMSCYLGRYACFCLLSASQDEDEDNDENRDRDVAPISVVFCFPSSILHFPVSVFRPWASRIACMFPCLGTPPLVALVARCPRCPAPTPVPAATVMPSRCDGATVRLKNAPALRLCFDPGGGPALESRLVPEWAGKYLAHWLAAWLTGCLGSASRQPAQARGGRV